MKNEKHDEQVHALLRRRFAYLDGRTQTRLNPNLSKLTIQSLNDKFAPVLARLPERYGTFISDYAKAVNVTNDNVFAITTGLNSGFVGVDKARIHVIRGTLIKAYPPMVPILVPAPSGAGKSQAAKPLLDKIINKIDREISQLYEDEMLKKAQTLARIDRLSKKEKRSQVEEDELKKLQLVLRFLETGGASVITDFTSKESITNYNQANELYAQIMGVAQPGYSLVRDNGGNLFYYGGNRAENRQAFDVWSVLEGLMDGTYKRGNSVGRKDNGTKQGRMGMGFVLFAQLSKFVCLHHKALIDDGLYQRFLLSYMPIDVEEEEDLNEAGPPNLLETWDTIVNFSFKFQGAPFVYARDADIQGHSNELKMYQKAAQNEGNLLKLSFLRKLYVLTHAIALDLHLKTLALEGKDGATLIYPGGLPDEAPQDDGFDEKYPWAVIPAETFETARIAANYYRENWDVITEVLYEESDEKRVVPVSPLCKKDALTNDSRDVLNVAFSIGEEYDDLGIIAQPTEIGKAKGATFYRNVGGKLDRRELVDRELQDHALMCYIDGNLKRGKRFLLREELTSDELKLILKQRFNDDMSDAEADDLETSLDSDFNERFERIRAYWNKLYTESNRPSFAYHDDPTSEMIEYLKKTFERYSDEDIEKAFDYAASAKDFTWALRFAVKSKNVQMLLSKSEQDKWKERESLSPEQQELLDAWEKHKDEWGIEVGRREGD